MHLLELKEITKSYQTGEFSQIALNQVNVNFRRNEFVAILGESGSGKTTLLNIIGGLDSFDSGDVVINGTSTRDFSDHDWDAYRNNSIGFIFQNYNLIPHLSIVDNVEIGMTLSGKSATQRHKQAMALLEQVGLKDHVFKKPNQLSGGQMQRVAIARALANDPDIILADEPTGALDSETSQQIMALIKTISNDKLVIMVTHNTSLAAEYASRIIKLADGRVVDDTDPADPEPNASYELTETSMSFMTALKLSGKNIATKKWRTALTALASSLGIIGIALILSLSSGFKIHIDQFQEDALSEFPIIIGQTATNIDQYHFQPRDSNKNESKYSNTSHIYPYDPSQKRTTHTNNLTTEYLDYINKIQTNICSSIGFSRIVDLKLLRRTAEGTFPVTIPIGFNIAGITNSPGSMGPNISSMRDIGLTSYPETLDQNSQTYLEKNYDILAGTYPHSETDLAIVVDAYNRINNSVLTNLGFASENSTSIEFKDIVGTELKLIHNDDYYTQTTLGNYIPRTDYDAMYDAPASIVLTISAIIRAKPHVRIELLGNGIVYSDKLIQRVVDQSSQSAIVKSQKESDVNVLTMTKLNESTKQYLITYLGGNNTPQMIFLYPINFSAKDAVINYLDKFNTDLNSDEKILYTDLANTITTMTGGIMNAITLVLIAFSAISLVVSLIMIGIITYISVLERTKEIGILRALGARKRDITNVFNAETFIIGTLSGSFGIIAAYVLTIPINHLIYNFTELRNVARLNPIHAAGLIVISILLTLVGGAIPALMAAKKDPVAALRTE